MKFTFMELQSLAILHGIPDEVFSWLANRGINVKLANQEHWFSKGQIAGYMFIVVCGTIQRYEEIAGKFLGTLVQLETIC